MSALKVLKLRNVCEVGLLLGRVYYEKHGVVVGENGLVKLLEKLYYAISEQRLDDEVGRQVYDVKSRLEKKYFGDKTLDYIDEEELKKNVRVWIELLSRALSAKVAFEPTRPVILSAESLMQAATNNSNPFFDESVWRAITDPARNDFKEATRCFMAVAWTAAAMATLRGAEAVLRQYYEFKTQAQAREKSWHKIIEELESRDDVSKTLLGYLDFIREKRNETQHPDKLYDQREAENIYTVAINAVNAMCNEMSASGKQS